MKNNADRWEQLAGGQAGPRHAWFRPLDRLMSARQNRLEAGAESYIPPIRLILTEGSAYVLAERGGATGIQFAIPGQPMTRDEAYLAGAFGREGVEKCLDMTIAVAREAGANFDWLVEHIESPALERIDKALGERRGPGPPIRSLEEEAVRKRMARRVKRGDNALREFFGQDWPSHMVAGSGPPIHPLPWEKPSEQKGEDSTPSDKEDSDA